MMTKEYSEAAAEVLEILEHTPIEKVNLIPTKFINYLKENASNDNRVDLDFTKPINEMNIKTETKGILSTISRNWWWNAEKKEEYLKLIKEKQIIHQEELKSKYNPNDIFKNRNQSIVAENTIESENNITSTDSIVEYKENVFTKFINRIMLIFRKRIKAKYLVTLLLAYFY